MQNDLISYEFLKVKACNMCEADESHFRVMGRRLSTSQGAFPRKRVGITTTVCKCKRCGLIFSNPQPVPHSIQDHYGVPPEAYWKDEYFSINPNYFQGEISRLKQLMEIKHGMKSLDIGAGLGKQMIALQQAGFDTYGLEPSEPFHERAIMKMGIPQEKLKLGSVEKLDYSENTFDFISFGAVLEHLYDPSESILKAMNWLKPGGLIHIEVPSSKWLIGNLINTVYKLQLTEYVGNLSPMHNPYHLYEFGLGSFQYHAEKYGYSIAHHEYYVCTTYLPKILDRPLRKVMRMTDKGMQLCVWLKKDTTLEVPKSN